MDLNEYREYYINSINASASSYKIHEVEAFVDDIRDILINDYGALSELDYCYIQPIRGTKSFKSMRVDGFNLDLSTNTLNLLIADYNPGPITMINNEFVKQNVQLMRNYFDNVMKGYFADKEESALETQTAINIINAADDISKIQLYIASTNIMGDRIKDEFIIDDFNYKSRNYKVELTIIDIKTLYNIKSEGMEKEPIIIETSEFNVDGIPCIKADMNYSQYEAFLAVVPGEFLADIYEKYGARLLESNVRSFLSARGGINKGIKNTILHEKEKFFAYNNGISTVADSIELSEDGMFITKFNNLQIINGGQTTASLASARIKDKADLSDIFVQMKLTLVHKDDEEFIRNVSKYANSQNKVTTADLNSNHQFYIRIEKFSRQIFIPKTSGKSYQQLWFFERSRGQYEQPMMKMTSKAKRDEYQKINPKDHKFTKTDLAKYINSADQRPYDVSWGAEVNAAKFQDRMDKIWKDNDSYFNEKYYKDLIAKAILFKSVEKIISQQDWYKENQGYRPQLVTYTIAKFVHEVEKMKLRLDYKYIWEKQQIPEEYVSELEDISYMAYKHINDPNRTKANISTYCKDKKCWDLFASKKYEVREETLKMLRTKEESEADSIVAKKEQKLDTSVGNQILIYQLGGRYWTKLAEIGKQYSLLTIKDLEFLDYAARCADGLELNISDRQVTSIIKVREKLKENGIDVDNI